MSYFHLTKIVTQGHTKIYHFFFHRLIQNGDIIGSCSDEQLSMLEHVMLGAAWLLVGQALLDWRSGVH